MYAYVYSNFIYFHMFILFLFSAVGGANAGPGVHDRIITLARAYPYGYSSLLKDISPSSG